MKNEKGVTIVSLIIYIGVLFVVVLLIGRMTTFVYKNSKVIASSSIEADYNKLNLYMLKETKREDNEINALGKIAEIENENKYKFEQFTQSEEEKEPYTAIKFKYDDTDKEEYNTIGFVDNSIYYNKVKICNNVDKFEVEAKKENGKEKIIIILKFTDGKEYSSEYVMRTQFGN